MNYKELLERSHRLEQERWMKIDKDSSRLAFLAVAIFDFTTYDDAASQFMARKAVEVCTAITNGTTFEYQEVSRDNYIWYLAMCNLPFFIKKLSWGTSIRGAWWNHNEDELDVLSTGLRDSDESKIECLDFVSQEQFREFMRAMIEFASPEMITEKENNT